MKNLLRAILRPFVNHPKKSLFVILLVFAMILGVPVLRNYLHPIRYLAYSQDTMKVKVPYKVGSEADIDTIEIPRGSELKVEELGEKVSTVSYNNISFEINNKFLKDTLEECIQTDYVYPRRLLNLQTDKEGKLAKTTVKKSEKVKVTHIDMDDFDQQTGQIHWFEVEKNGKKYWLSGDYVELSKAASKHDYSQDITHSTYWDETYGKGYSKDAYINQIDYKPQPKVRYENNPMPEEVNAVHVSLENYLKDKDYFLDLKNHTAINAFVIVLKGDGGELFYDSDVLKHYLKKPEKALIASQMNKQELTKIIDELHDNGYYVIARVVAFKDSIFAQQNVKDAITEKGSNKLFVLNEEYWPSVYSRKAWMYNVDIAKEIADCHVNEIQFDYCRFPDGTAQVRKKINMKNTYDESKAAAIQGFLMYAKAELAPYEVYVAADIFAWPIVADDDQDIGQFFPAIAGVVDVISPMPYADLFSDGAMGIEKPVEQPKETLYKFSSKVDSLMKNTGSNAQYRTWIMAYMPYEAKEIKEEIKGITEAGYQGYLIWYGNGASGDIKSVEKGFISSSIKE